MEPENEQQIQNNTLKKHSRAVIVIVGAVLVIVAVLGLRFLSQEKSSPVPLLPTSQVKPPPPGVLSLFPAEQSATVSSEIAFNVVVDGAGENVNGADMVIVYDPTLVEVTGFEEVSSRFTYYLRKPNDEEGKSRYIITAIKDLSDNDPVGEETLVRVLVKPLVAGETSLSFEFIPDSNVSSTIITSPESKNILGKVSGAVIQVE